MGRLLVALVAALATHAQCFKAGGPPQAHRKLEHDESGSGSEDIGAMLHITMESITTLLTPGTCDDSISTGNITSTLYNTLSEVNLTLSTTESFVKCFCSLSLEPIAQAMHNYSNTEGTTEDIATLITAILSSMEALMSTSTGGICESGDCKTALLGVFNELSGFLLAQVLPMIGVPGMTESEATELSGAAEAMWGCTCGGSIKWGPFFTALSTGVSSIVAAAWGDNADVSGIVTASLGMMETVMPMVMSTDMLCGGTCAAVFGQVASLVI